MVATLSPDVVFRSPILTTPFVGPDEVRDVFAVVLAEFKELTYTDDLAGDGIRVHFFTTTVRGRDVEGVQRLRLDPDGKVREITVIVRPIAGLAAVANAIGTGLARRRFGRVRPALIGAMSQPLLGITALTDAVGPRLAQGRPRSRD
jgi:SnoaL-like domain